MAATHITEAKKAQALRDQADSIMRLEAKVGELESKLDRVLEILDPAKPVAAEEPKKPEQPKPGKEAASKADANK